MLSRMPSEASGPTGLHTSAEKSRMIMKHISWLKYSCPATKQTLKRWEKIVLQGRLNRGGLKIKVKLAENNWSQAHIRNASAKVFCLHFNNEVNQLTTRCFDVRNKILIFTPPVCALDFCDCPC